MNDLLFDLLMSSGGPTPPPPAPSFIELEDESGYIATEDDTGRIECES